MKHKPIHNLGAFAHAPKTNVNFKGPVKAQTEAKPHLAAPHKGDKGKHGHVPMKKT